MLGETNLTPKTILRLFDLFKKVGTLSLFLAIICVRSQKANAQSAEAWFTAKQIANKTWLIDDHGIDNIYLLEGKDSALLIDAGFGLANLKSFVGQLTSKPLIIVNTHGHPDHAGGDWQ